MEQEILIPYAERGLSDVIEETDSEPEEEPRANPPANVRVSSRHPEPRETRSRPALGPLLAVVGLCGGAGATTLAYLIGRYESEALARPVLVCDTGGPSGGLAAYSRVEMPRSLPRIADAVAAHTPLAGTLFADDGSGLRVIASRPELPSRPDPRGVTRVLCDARAAHALTIVDCGTVVSEVARHVLHSATHALWVLPASNAGLSRAGGVLGLFESGSWRHELVIARNDPGERKAPIDQLTALAERRRTSLVLMPSVPDLATMPVEEALEATALALDAIHMVIAR